jgi:hypothetical protein
MNGHLQGVTMPGPGGDLQLARNKTLPAFTYCSLDNNMGDGDPTVGDDAGCLNRYLWWQQDDSTDTVGKWEMTCLLIGSSPAATCTVDITPRRCQAFTARPDMYCQWMNTDIATGTVVQSGTVMVDPNGLVNVPQATVKKTKNRIAITIVADVNSDGGVDVIDLLYLVDAFGSVPGDPNYNPDCDFNHDDSVDVVDLLMLVENFGK